MKTLKHVIGVLYALIGLYLWIYIGYDVLTKDLGRIETVQIHWKHMLQMILFVLSGLYLLRDLK